MERNPYTLATVFNHLRSHAEPFVLRDNGQPPEWSDEALHRTLYERQSELYALLALAGGVQTVQRERVLFQLLRASRVGLDDNVRQTLDRVTRILLETLGADRVLRVFLALRRERANHKHARKAILRYILNHPQFEDLLGSRRPAVADSLEHAIGKNVARACAKWLAEGERSRQTYVRRNLLRFARDPARVGSLFPALYGGGVRSLATGAYQQTHRDRAEQLDREPERPKTVTATNRGDIAATLVHLYRGGSSPELERAVEAYVEAAARPLPYFEGKVAVVLDASASTRGYGEREYCAIAQSVAFQRVLQRRCDRLEVFPVGGSGTLPQPQGPSDLAMATIAAIESQPDLVAIVSDGYENTYPGDLARVTATFTQLGIQTPVVFCHSKFSPNDDLSLRRNAPNLPEFEFWHQEDFEGVLVALFSFVEGEKGERTIHQFLLKKLEIVEQWLDRQLEKVA